jgi:outer membrane autotransporter protein
MLDGSRAAPALRPTVAQLEASSAEAATQTLAGLAAEAPGGVQNLNLMALDRFTEMLRTSAPAGLRSGRFAWARGFASSGRSRAAVSAADYDLHGAAAGAETAFGRARLGVAAARIDGDFSRDTDRAAFDASIFALTARYAVAEVDFDAAIAYGAGSPDLRRVRAGNGAAETLATDARTDLWSVSVGASLAAALGPVALTPHTGLVYHRATLKAFDEHRTLAVRTSDSTADSLRGRIGASVSASVGRVRPYGDLSVSVEILDKQPRIAASLIGAPDSGFDLFGEARRRVAVDAEAGLSVVLSEGLEAYVAGGMTANDLLAGRRLSAGLTYRW